MHIMSSLCRRSRFMVYPVTSSSKFPNVRMYSMSNIDSIQLYTVPRVMRQNVKFYFAGDVALGEILMRPKLMILFQAFKNTRRLRSTEGE
jgi:hypothetical protein